MHPLPFSGYYSLFGTVTQRLPPWRAPTINDEGAVTRQQMRHLDRKQPDLAAAIRDLGR